MTTLIPSPPRKLPLPESDTAFFWASGADGLLRIAQCRDCRHYQHPPLPLCPVCHGEAVGPVPVSGRGRVATFTVNCQPWLPGLEDRFVFAVVELVEQSELYVFTNVLGPVDRVKTGMPVSVCFERHDDIYLPLFVSEETSHAG